MPSRDKKGPLGQGPNTGLRLGSCDKDNASVGEFHNIDVGIKRGFRRGQCRNRGFELGRQSINGLSERLEKRIYNLEQELIEVKRILCKLDKQENPDIKQ